MFTPPGANNACHSHPARCKLRLHFRATIAASIVDYNLRSTLKKIVNRNDKQASDRVSALLPHEQRRPRDNFFRCRFFAYFFLKKNIKIGTCFVGITGITCHFRTIFRGDCRLPDYVSYRILPVLYTIKFFIGSVPFYLKFHRISRPI